MSIEQGLNSKYSHPSWFAISSKLVNNKETWQILCIFWKGVCAGGSEAQDVTKIQQFVSQPGFAKQYLAAKAVLIRRQAYHFVAVLSERSVTIHEQLQIMSMLAACTIEKTFVPFVKYPVTIVCSESPSRPINMHIHLLHRWTGVPASDINALVLKQHFEVWNWIGVIVLIKTRCSE